jgi:hypothetical protein
MIYLTVSQAGQSRIVTATILTVAPDRRVWVVRPWVTFKVATRADDPLLRDCDHVQARSLIDASGAMLGAEHTARPLVWHRALPARRVLAPACRRAHDRSTDLGRLRIGLPGLNDASPLCNWGW